MSLSDLQRRGSRGNAGQQQFQFLFDSMACTCDITVCTDSRTHAQALAELAMQEVRRIECKFSRYRPDSAIGRINAAAGGDWVECDEETDALLGYADVLFCNSDGLFDVTSGILRRVWNFKEPDRTDFSAIEAVLPLIGWDRVERRAGAVRLPQAGMEIDFGGFGKEYAADRAAAVLANAHVDHGYVNLGGDLRVLGPKADGQPWHIGIQHPRDRHSVFAEIAVEQGALATSGDYERYFERDGRRYCHVLNPRTGFPVSHWQSVSVLAPTALVAGSLTTVAMLKEADGLDFLREAGMDFLAIDRNGQVFQANA